MLGALWSYTSAQLCFGLNAKTGMLTCWWRYNVHHICQGINTVIKMYALGPMDIGTKFNGNLFHSCWGISLKTKMSTSCWQKKKSEDQFERNVNKYSIYRKHTLQLPLVGIKIITLAGLSSNDDQVTEFFSNWQPRVILFEPMTITLTKTCILQTQRCFPKVNKHCFSTPTH